MDIKITKSKNSCAHCGNDFVHDEAIHSLACRTEEGLERSDYCANCWEADFGKDAYSLWTPKFYDPKVALEESPEVFSPLRQLFYDAVESEERLEQAKAYLAAQLLRRQKVFRKIRESDGIDEEVRVVLYSDRIGNRLIEVRDPSFTYQEMEEGRKRLIQCLEQLEAPEPEGEPEQMGDGDHEQTTTSE